MPIRYHTNKPLHCDKLDAGLINSIQGCKYESGEIPTKFSPHNKQNIIIKDDLSNPIKPSTIAPVYHNPMLNPFLPIPIPTIQTPIPNIQTPIPTIQTPIPNINTLSNVTTRETNYDDNNLNINTKFTFFSEELRQEHLNYIKSFSQHPDFRNIDKTAAQFSNAAYLENSEVINEYLNELTDLGEQGWKLSPEPRASNEWIKTFVNENGDVAVSMRTSTWFGDDGVANIFNTTGGTEARQMINDGLHVDVRTRKARLMDDTYKFIKDTYGGNVKFTTGHSQAGFDSAYSQREFFPEAEVINFNPAPKGVVPRDIGRSWVTPNDVVSLSGKLKKITNPNQYDVHTVKSTANTPLNRLTGGHMIDNFVDEFATNAVEPIETTPLLENPSGLKLSNNLTRSFGSAAKNIARGGLVGAAGIGADLLVDNLIPEDTPEVFKTTAKATAGAGFMRAAASMVGAPSMAAGEMIVPLFASYEAANQTEELVDNALEDTDLTTVEKSTISGLTSGAVGGGVFSGASMATVRAARAAGQAARAATAAARAATVTTEVGTEAEMTSLLTASGEAAETVEAAAAGLEAAETAEVAEVAVTGLETAEATALALTEGFGAAAAIEGGLNPVADAAFVASAAALGMTALAGGIGATFGFANGIERQRKQAEEQDKLDREAFDKETENIIERQKALQQANMTRQEIDMDYMFATPQFGETYEDRLDWLAKHRADYENDDRFNKIGQTDHVFKYDEQIQYIAMREEQKYDKATEMYRMIENDSEYKKSLEANDRTAVNRAIRNVIWANNEDYGDIMNNESTFPQIDKDGSWIQTTFDDHSHIWSDSPNDFNEARPRRRFAEADTTDNDELPTDHLAQY